MQSARWESELADYQTKGKTMGAKLVRVVEEKGTKILQSGSVLHKYVADLLVDGAEVNAAKVAVTANDRSHADYLLAMHLVNRRDAQMVLIPVIRHDHVDVGEIAECAHFARRAGRSVSAGDRFLHGQSHARFDPFAVDH